MKMMQGFRQTTVPSSGTEPEKTALHGRRVLKEQLIQQRTKEHPTFGCSFAYIGVQTQCTDTVRIIAPSRALPWCRISSEPTVVSKAEQTDIIYRCLRREYGLPDILRHLRYPLRPHLHPPGRKLQIRRRCFQ